MGHCRSYYITIIPLRRYVCLIEKRTIAIENSYKIYEGHSRINDNEFISWKKLLESVFFVMSYEHTYITYLCLKFVAFIMASFDAMTICIDTRSVHGRENLIFKPFLLGVG